MSINTPAHHYIYGQEADPPVELPWPEKYVPRRYTLTKRGPRPESRDRWAKTRNLPAFPAHWIDLHRSHDRDPQGDFE